MAELILLDVFQNWDREKRREALLQCILCCMQAETQREGDGAAKGEGL